MNAGASSPRGQPIPVYIIGAQSTGKTTLVEALKEHFDGNPAAFRGISKPDIIPEVARIVLEEFKITGSDVISSPEKAVQIQRFMLRAQYVAENLFQDSWYISDRSALDVLVYTEFFAGVEAVNDMKHTNWWQELLPRLQSGLVILCEPVEEWLIDDGLRLMPGGIADWLVVHEMFIRALNREGIFYVLMSKQLRDIRERVRFVSEWIFMP